MWEISHSFLLRTSRNPQNRCVSHYRCVWGQSRSVTSDDLCKAKTLCQMSYVVVLWSKPCTMSPFWSPCRQQVPWLRRTFPWKSRSDAVTLMTSWLGYLTWPGHFFCPKLRKGCLIRHARFQRDAPRGALAILQKLMGAHYPLPLHGRGLKNFFF